AFLAHALPARFPPQGMMVITSGPGLAEYISELLPSQGVAGVRVSTFGAWAEHELRACLPWLRAKVTGDAPPEVTRVKSHPSLLGELDRMAGEYDGKRDPAAAVELWADLLTDLPRLHRLLTAGAEMPLAERDVVEAHRLIVDRVTAVTARDPRERSFEAQ